MARGLDDRFESKARSIAVHGADSVRRSSATEALVRDICEPLAHDHGMELLPFDGGLECLLPGKTKGTQY